MITANFPEIVESTPYLQGVEAGSRDQEFAGLTRNPYPEKTVEHDKWSLGWCKGFADQP